MIHRLQRHGDRSYGKARTVCGLDVKGQIHPLAEVYTDGKHAELPIDPKCAGCWTAYEAGVAESRARAGYVTIHALFHGATLCGYGEGKVPAEWPVDQDWLAVTEIGRPHNAGQWCQACLQKASEGGLPAAAAGTNALDHMRAPKNPDDGMRRFEVWSLRTIGNGGVDVRVGEAIENRDGTISVQLPALGVRLKLKSA